jgi:LmbE family N-acetylglucosaminyl deacetylase
MLFSGPKPYRLDLLSFPSNLKATVLAPHPDDFDATRVTMRRVRENGNPVHVAVLSACSGVEDSFCSPPTLEAKAALREKEQRDSCRFFGLPEDALEFPCLRLDADGQPADDSANTDVLRSILARTEADWVFLPHGNDTNSGHRQTWAMFRRAASSLRRPLMGFYNHDPKTISLQVDAVMAFGEEMATWKGELLRFHRSQQHRNLLRRGRGLDARILETNKQMARQLGLEARFSEAFALEQF